MPLYSYECEKCKHVFEVLQKEYDVDSEKCPKCAGKSKKQVGHSSFILKGSGWYRDGYSSAKPSTPTDVGTEHSSGTAIRFPIIGDKNTGKNIGIGKPEISQ